MIDISGFPYIISVCPQNGREADRKRRTSAKRLPSNLLTRSVNACSLRRPTGELLWLNCCAIRLDYPHLLKRLGNAFNLEKTKESSVPAKVTGFPFGSVRNRLSSEPHVVSVVGIDFN